MADNPASTGDIASRWRPLSSDESIVADVLLADAWALLKHAVPTLEARLDAIPATLDVALVRMVLVAMVKRVLMNPDGLQQETIQDYSYTRAGADTAGGLYVSDAELDLLAATDVGTGGAFTIRPVALVPPGCEIDTTDWAWRP